MNLNHLFLFSQGWKNERVIYEEFGDRIILVEPGDAKTHWNKVNEVLKVVDMDLGLAEVNLCEYQDKRVKNNTK